MATEAVSKKIEPKSEPGEPEYPVFQSNAEVRAWLGMPAEIEPLPEWHRIRNDRWQELEGILSDHPEHDTTEMKRRNRIEEEEHDARKFA